MDPRVLLLAFALVLLAAACGSSPAAHPAASARVSHSLAFARCMRAHGVANFPDPDPQGNFPSFSTGVSKQASSAANDACKHLLSSGGTATPLERQQKLEFGVKVAECLRAHGYPNFPDPAHLGQQALPPGIDTSSPQFQAVETTCEVRARKALGLP
ncbi:MAG TPA: hypothetical protein VII54_13290 [Gaiellaceae bacterium]